MECGKQGQGQIALRPEGHEAHSNLGVVLADLQEWDGALASYDRALELLPQFAKAWVNRGVALNALKQLPMAIASYDRAIAIEPEFPGAHWNKALACLRVGDLELGWKLFEWRWKNVDANPKRRSYAQPLWLGELSLNGKTILLHHEQGMGDTLQFCRYVPLLAKAGARVMLEVPRPLVNLLKGLEGVDTVVQQDAKLSSFDLHCPMMSLPLAFKTSLLTIPFADRYLNADEDKIAYWDRALGARARPRVGLVWNGGFRAHQPEVWAVNERRNMPVQHLAALKGLDCQFISLQKGDPAEAEFKQLQQEGWDGPDILNRVDQLNDFSDTAALIASLDLVIAVDTSVAHLAGALGKPVWLLNRFDSCWRWLIDRQDSPWYQSMRIFNQKSPGDWDGVMKDVVAASSISAKDHLKKS